MYEPFEVAHEGVLQGTPEQVWDAITVHAGGWLWPVSYEGGVATGLASTPGEVTAWEPHRRFSVRNEREDGWWNQGGDGLSAFADAHRREWAFVLAATVRVTRDLDLAEECVQEAYVSALTAWARDGMPERPGAWLTTAARRTALNALKRSKTLQAKLPLLIEPDATDELPEDDDPIPDDRLRLVFTCCHPALAREAQVALTLRLVCGVATADIAQAFLVSEPTMAARLALNRAIAVSMADGPGAALALLEELERDERLAGYRYLPAAKADVLRRLGRRREAAESYRAALALTANAAERAFLEARLADAG